MHMQIAKWSDVEDVLSRLSDQHRAEYESAGWPSEEFMARMAQFMALGTTETLWFDGKPQAIISIKPDSPYPVTWLAATKEFFAKGISTTRFARKYMLKAVERYGPIVSIIAPGRPQAEKWMKALGYRKISENMFLIA